MTGRRLPNSFATVATAGRGEEPPTRPCAELDDSGRPKYAHLFDAVLDHKVGPDHWRAVAACKAICATCPLAVRRACFLENRDEPGVIAGLTLKERTVRTPPTRHPTCGKPHGSEAHARNNEETCDDCKAANNKKKRDYGKRYGKREIRHDARLDDLRDLISQGATMAEVCERLGTNRAALWKWCKAHDHGEEWAALSPPVNGNQYVKGVESITTRRRGKKVAA